MTQRGRRGRTGRVSSPPWWLSGWSRSRTANTTALTGQLRVLCRGERAQPPRPGAPVSGVGIPPSSLLATWGHRARQGVLQGRRNPARRGMVAALGACRAVRPRIRVILGAEEPEPTSSSLVHGPVAADSKIFSQGNCLPQIQCHFCREAFPDLPD